jgi:glycerol-3-phosphate dehydrogenase
LKLKYNLDNETSRYLKRNYGDRSEDIVSIMLNENKKEKISMHFPYLEAELIYSIRNEFTLDCIDFMDYRTNMIKLNGHEALECVEKIATIIGVRIILLRE